MWRGAVCAGPSFLPRPGAPGAPSGAPAGRGCPVEPLRGELCKMPRLQAAAWGCGQQPPRPGPPPLAARAHASPVTMGGSGAWHKLKLCCVVKSGGPQIQGPGCSLRLSGAVGSVGGLCAVGPLWGGHVRGLLCPQTAAQNSAGCGCAHDRTSLGLGVTPGDTRTRSCRQLQPSGAILPPACRDIPPGGDAGAVTLG